VTTPSSLPLAARKSRPSWLVPARVVEMANRAQRRVNSIRRWVIIFCNTSWILDFVFCVALCFVWLRCLAFGFALAFAGT
jgi:hypothetical protein